MKNNQKGFGAFEIVIVLAMIFAVSGIGLYVYQRAKTVPTTTDEILRTISSDAKNTYSNAVFETKKDWMAEASATAFNAVPGHEYTVSGVGKGIWLAYEQSDAPKTTKQLFFFKRTIPPAKNLDEIKNWVGSQLITYGFNTTDNVTYNKDDVICNVLNDPSSLFANQENTLETNTSTNLLEVTCFGNDDLQNSAKQMKPFIDEYLRANPALKASDLAVGPFVIKSTNGAGVIGSSRTAGYDIAEMVISTKTDKKIALFYANDAQIDSEDTTTWRYVTQANDEFGFRCEDIRADADARKALFDQVCLSDEGQVRLDTENRALQ